MQPLLVPKIMPDEFLMGYERRIASVNGFINFKKSRRFIQSHFVNMNGEAHGDYFKANMYAHMCKVDIHDLVRNHTLLPIFRATSKYKSDHRHGNPEDSEIILQHTSKQMKDCMHYCPECAKEDMDFHGISYWRRSHQIPGIDWCTKHASPLYEYDAANEEFYPSPHSLPGDKKSFLDEEIENNPIVRTFTEVIQATLELDHPIHTDSFFRVIYRKALEVGVYIGTKGGGDLLLSDLAIQTVPVTWLNKHFPAFKKKQNGKILSEVDNAVTKSGRSSTASIYNLLALSILFNSPSKALKALLSCYNNEVKPSTRCSVMKEKSNHVLVQYIACKGNIHLMSKALNCHYTTLKHHMNKLGLPSLAKYPPQIVEAIIDYLTGTSSDDSTSRSDIQVSQFNKFISYAGKPNIQHGYGRN